MRSLTHTDTWNVPGLPRGRFKLLCLDDLIVYEAGMSIPEIVDKHGWHYFRDLEFEVGPGPC